MGLSSLNRHQLLDQLKKRRRNLVKITQVLLYTKESDVQFTDKPKSPHADKPRSPPEPKIDKIEVNIEKEKLVREEVTKRENGHLNFDETEDQPDEDKKENSTDSPQLSGPEDDGEESEQEVKLDTEKNGSDSPGSDSSTVKEKTSFYSSIRETAYSLITRSQQLSPSSVYSYVSVEISNVRSNFKSWTSTPQGGSEQKAVFFDYKPVFPSWLTHLVVQLKFLLLAVFYLHLGIWALISLLLILINIFTLLLGPWAIFPIGGWGLGLYLHLIGTSYLLQVSGTNADGLRWLEAPLNKSFMQAKGYVHSAIEAVTHKYNDLCHGCCQGANEGAS